GGALAPEQGLLEFPAVHTQVGALDVVGRQAGVLVQLGRDLRLSFRTQGGAGQERLRIVVEREILDLAQQRLESRRLIGQLVVIPGRGGEGRQREHIRQVDARVELRRVGPVVEVQYLREQDDAVQVELLFVLQNAGERRRSRGPIALAKQIFRRVPTLVAR